MTNMAASFRWILQLHKDVPKAARFYSEGLGFDIHSCTLRWAELQSGPLKLALLHSSRDVANQKDHSNLLSFTVTDINITVSKLMALGAELDGPIKYEIHGKERGPNLDQVITLGCFSDELADFSGCCSAVYRRTHVGSLRACLKEMVNSMYDSLEQVYLIL